MSDSTEILLTSDVGVLVPKTPSCDVKRFKKTLKAFYPGEIVLVGYGKNFELKLRHHDTRRERPKIMAAYQRACQPPPLPKTQLDQDPRTKEPWRIGTTDTGEEVFAPIAGPGARKVAHLKATVGMCVVCRSTFRFRGSGTEKNAVIDTAGRLYHRHCYERAARDGRLELPAGEVDLAVDQGAAEAKRLDAADASRGDQGDEG